MTLLLFQYYKAILLQSFVLQLLKWLANLELFGKWIYEVFSHDKNKKVYLHSTYSTYHFYSRCWSLLLYLITSVLDFVWSYMDSYTHFDGMYKLRRLNTELKKKNLAIKYAIYAANPCRTILSWLGLVVVFLSPGMKLFGWRNIGLNNM